MATFRTRKKDSGQSYADRFLSALLANPNFRDFLSKKGVASKGLTQKDMRIELISEATFKASTHIE